ncbi:MAG: GspH/FimT family pseudopilin [Cytophaga sp.]|nr:GspH/FimT family pseudopilin [Undibacterium sp.]
MQNDIYPSQRMQNAFTLVELLITLTIVGILGAVAFPSYQSLMSVNRITTAVSSLHGALLLARSEAIKRGSNVTICRSETANNPIPQCSVTNSTIANTGWADGWIIFNDLNRNGIYEPGNVPPDSLVMVQGRLSKDINDISIMPNGNGLRFVTFGPTGQVFGAFVQLAVNRPSWDANASNDRFICIASGGRARVSKTSC